MQKFLTVKQFADKLGVNRYTIYKRLKSESIKAVHPGLTWLIPEKEANKWVAHKVKVRMRLHKIKRANPKDEIRNQENN